LVLLFSSKFIGIHGSRSGRDGGIGLHESSVLIALVFALSEKQIPQIVENGKPNRQENDSRGLRFFASRGSSVRSRSRPPDSLWSEVR